MAINKADLAKLTPAERVKLQKVLDEINAEQQEQANEQARTEIGAILTKYNTTLEVLGLAKRSRGKGKKTASDRPAVYHKEGEKDYSGIGRVPNWMTADIAKGINPKTYLVKGQTASTAVENLWQKKQKQKP